MLFVVADVCCVLFVACCLLSDVCCRCVVVFFCFGRAWLRLVHYLLVFGVCCLLCVFFAALLCLKECVGGCCLLLNGACLLLCVDRCLLFVVCCVLCLVY